MKKQTKVMVTGGAGFIGHHLVNRLVEMGYYVDVVDNFSTGKRENINPKASVSTWDVSEFYFNGNYDYVFHLAALPSVPYSVEHPTETNRVNMLGTYNVLKGACDSNHRGWKIRKVILASSSAVYGTQKLPYTEETQLKPESPYAFQKMVSEQYCNMFDEIYGLPTLSLRLFNVYGPGCDDSKENSLVIAKFKKLAKEHNPLIIYGDGKQTRDFVHVDDVVEAFIKAMESDVRNENINICSGESVSINKLANLICEQNDCSNSEIIYSDKRKGDVVNTLGDNSKAERLLGWKPKISIEEGLKRV